MAQRRIVLADDDQQIRSFPKAILKAQGFDVHEAGDGEEAVEVLMELGGLVDLLITDIKMLRMDGVALAKAVAELVYRYQRFSVIPSADNRSTEEEEK